MPTKINLTHTPKKATNKVALFIFAWFLSIMFSLAAFSAFFSFSFFHFLIFSFVSLLINPSIYRTLKRRYFVWLTPTICVVVALFALFLGGLYNPHPQNSNSDYLLTKTQKEKEALEKQLATEKAKLKKLEKAIAEATTVNHEYDTGFDLAGQPIDQTKEANKSIADLGNSTKDKQLFSVLEIVDGDTIKVSELGTLRLIGIDTPETKDPRKTVQCFGVEASNRANELLKERKVWLEFDPANRIDKYGRTLAYLYRDDGYFYNLEMIKEGYAHSYTKYPHPKMDEFNLAQKEARENQKGLWAPHTCNGNTEQPAKQPEQTSAPKEQPPVVNNTLKVKKSKNNICHAPGTTYYDKTTNYTLYDSLEECLASGGRLPNK